VPRRQARLCRVGVCDKNPTPEPPRLLTNRVSQVHPPSPSLFRSPCSYGQLHGEARHGELQYAVVEEARKVRRLGEVFVLERSAQGGRESDRSCLDRISEVR